VTEEDLDRANVLITSDDAEFSRAVTGRWQAETLVPAFTLVGTDLCESMDPDSFTLAIAGEWPGKDMLPTIQALSRWEKPIVLVASGARTCQEVSRAFPRVTVVRQFDGWVDAVVTIAQEVLKRCCALERAEHAEQVLAELEGEATLGRYMLEMRDPLNNALTSLLGNSELLLLEPVRLTTQALEQVDTIRNMAMRVHEVLARFSSLEKELELTGRHAQNQRTAKTRAVASGL